MRKSMLLLVAGVLAGCQTPMPPVDPNMAWVEFSTPTPGGKLLMAERLDKQRLTDGRFFQVTPGSHELLVRFDFEAPGGGAGMLNDPVERLCYLTIRFDHFEAGQRYVLEGRSLMFTPSARLYNNAKREIVAEDRDTYCAI